MVGYAGEDTNFALELTYNYGIDCQFHTRNSIKFGDFITSYLHSISI